MKKILTVSLCSMLAVCAANADIASVEYVTGELAGKQDTISDLATIRSGAALGATAAQDLGDLGVTATATELNYVDGVTSNIQTQLNAKQAKLNYTAENTANKVTSVTSTSTDTQYPSAKAMYTALAGKQASLGYTAENAANKVTSVSSTSTDTQYPSAKAMYTALSTKQNASTIGTVTAAAMGTTATTVVGAINEVAGEAAAAQSTADTAVTNAAAAQSTANTAVTNAAAAQSTANTAVTNAAAAQSTANTANTAIAAMDLAATGGAGKVIRSVTQTDGKVTASAEVVDTTATRDSAKLITSGAVYSGLEARVAISQGTANAGKGLVVDRTTGNLTLTDIATQTELNSVSTSAATNALAALDYNSQADTAVGGDKVGEGGKYIVSVIQEDGAVSILTKDYVDVITDETKVAPTSNAVYDALAGKVNVALGSGAASKAVITDASGNITTGTITSALIANSTITNNDIASNAAIAQSKISGLTTSLAGKQNLVSDGVEGKFYVADYVSGWKDMFEAMPKNERCSGDDVKCSLTHKNGKYYWEIVRE
jgi:hypothetical protein